MILSILNSLLGNWLAFSFTRYAPIDFTIIGDIVNIFIITKYIGRLK